LVVFVADHLAQLLAGRWVQVPQSAQAAAQQNAVHGCWGQGDVMEQFQVGGQPGRSVFGLPPQRFHQIGDVAAGLGLAAGRDVWVV
jgi:hypothetical protein